MKTNRTDKSAAAPIARTGSRRLSIVPRLLSALLLLALASCSTTRLIPDGDQLYTGMKKIEYADYETSDHFLDTQTEVEAALACTPNGGILGSPYLRTPLNYKLWIWNAWAESEKPLSKWICKTFGKQPVLMSNVNPELRAQIAQGVMKKNGYFDASVVSRNITNRHNAKKAKIAYRVSAGPLTTLDSIGYTRFPDDMQQILTTQTPLIKKGDPFCLSELDAERKRVATLMRNNGYYYFNQSFMSWLADTTRQSHRADMRLQLADSLPDDALKRWTMGHTTIQLRRHVTDSLTDSLRRGHLTVLFSGKRPPVRTGVLMRDITLRHGQPYSIDRHNESLSKIGSNGIFSMTDMQFTPRADTLDLNVNCLFEKPYDVYIEANMTGKTNQRMGPGLTIGLTKRNAFRGGERLSFNLKGYYERLTGRRVESSADKINSYEYGGDVTLELPRILWPRRRITPERIRQMREKGRKPKKFYSTPSTTLKLSRQTLHRASLFRQHSLTAEITYRWQPTANLSHELSPLIVEYNHFAHMTDSFRNLLKNTPALLVSMTDRLTPKARYTISIGSPATSRNPMRFSATLTEAGSVLSLGYMALGRKWNDTDKKMFSTPYAQYLKLRTDLTKTWAIGTSSSFVAHLAAGVAWAFGNSTQVPYGERFYAGGANSVRAFNARSLGPGNVAMPDSRLAYVLQVGDVLLGANLEWRFPLVGSLDGAAFIDAGNVWALRDSGLGAGATFRLKNLPEQTALGTGIGLRYDLDFIILRLDWGIGLHVPYETSKSGYFNIPRFRDGQTIHFAIGYPF